MSEQETTNRLYVLRLVEIKDGEEVCGEFTFTCPRELIWIDDIFEENGKYKSVEKYMAEDCKICD